MPTALISMEVTLVCAAMGSQEMEPTAKTSTNVYPTHAIITLIALILQEVTCVSVNRDLLVMALNVTISMNVPEEFTIVVQMVTVLIPMEGSLVTVNRVTQEMVTLVLI